MVYGNLFLYSNAVRDKYDSYVYITLLRFFSFYSLLRTQELESKRLSRENTLWFYIYLDINYAFHSKVTLLP